MGVEQTKDIDLTELDADFCSEVAAIPGGENIKKCFACGTCAAGCPVTNIYEEYNSRTLIRQILLGMREEVLKSPVIWYCMMCYRCHSRCPQEVNFPDIMRALRYLAVKYGYAPKELLIKGNDIDVLSQKVRRDMIKENIDGKKQLIDKIKDDVH